MMIFPNEIASKANRMEAQNHEFRLFLKDQVDIDELDRQFMRLHNELFADYDCCKCNNCCKVYPITLGSAEASAIAQFLECTPEEFVTEYLIKNESGDEDEGEYKFKSTPCIFLGEDGKCKIQCCKPTVCKAYPHTDKPERLLSMYSMIDNAGICPVVFEILERLKKIYRFRRGE